MNKQLFPCAVALCLALLLPFCVPATRAASDVISVVVGNTKGIVTHADVAAAVTEDELRTLLTAAMMAPSACNSRPWEFIVLRERQTLLDVAAFHPYTQMLKTAAAAIVVVADPALQSGISEGFFPQDCAAATQNILLEAVNLGLGTCWCGIYPKEDKIAGMRDLLGIASPKIPFCIIAVGKPAEPFGTRGSYEEEKVTWK